MLALCALAIAARPALADGGSVSYSTWVVSSDTVMLRFLLPVAEAQRLTGADIPVLTVGKLGDYVLHHTAVTASGHDCPAMDQGYDLGKVDPIRAGPGLYGFEIFFRCTVPMTALVLEDRALFGHAPGHVDYARIEVNGHFTEQLFTAGHQRLRIADLAAVPGAGIGRYARLGLLHILHSADRLCFLLAVLLLARSRSEVVGIALGLAAGYGLALLAQASGLIVARVAPVEAFIGFLVALCAVAVALPQLERPGAAAAGWACLLALLAVVAAVLRAGDPALLLAGAAGLSAGFLTAIRIPGRWRWLWLLPACLLGFLDGFVLPAQLAPLRLADWTRTRMALGFDLGALALDFALLAGLAGLYALLRAGRLAPPRPALNVLAAACLGGFGMFWLVSRLHGYG